MSITPKKINNFLFFKLPLAFIAGVRVKNIDQNEAIVTVRHRWINQNPYKSMFWAVQGMAAELTTGILVMKGISDAGKKISMLVTQQQGTFTKKGTGVLRFECRDGHLITEAIQKAIAKGEGQTLTLTSQGYNAENIPVSHFSFEWSLKVKS